MWRRSGGLTVVVRCAACGAGSPMRFRTTSTPRPGELAVRLDVEREDLVWIRLFTEAHRGPFGGTR